MISIPPSAGQRSAYIRLRPAADRDHRRFHVDLAVAPRLRRAWVPALFVFLCSATQAAANEFEWLPSFAKHMGSLTFTRKDAETVLKLHSKLFETSRFEDEHPGYTGCEHLLRVGVDLLPSVRPVLADIQKLFGQGKKLPRLPDSGELQYMFYPSSPREDIVIRVIAKIDEAGGAQRVRTLSIDREKICATQGH